MENPDCAQDYFSWEYLRTETRDWAASASSADFRWQTLCVAASWVIRYPETWGFCYHGALAVSLVALFCAVEGVGRSRFYDTLVSNHQMNDWPALLSRNWYIFDVIARGAPRLWDDSQRLSGRTAVVPRQCEGEFELGKPVQYERRLIFDAAQAVAGGGDAQVESVWNATGLVVQSCQHKDVVPDLCGATSCLLRAWAAPNREEAYRFAAIGEQAVIACTGRGTENMVPILLWSHWPLARLLALVHQKLDLDRNDRDSDGMMPPINASREVFGSSGGVVLWNDLTFPWVRHLAETVPLHEIYQEFQWPQTAPSFAEIVEDINHLIDTHSFAATTGGAGYGTQWHSMCFVCKDGTESLDTSEGTIYRKTPILQGAPALSRFIDLFGETGRVRLSAVLPGGIIGWHPDNGVAENGRMIIHVPVQTSRLALNRLGHLLFYMPAGKIHWLDYSYPHTVYNGDSVMPRIHLVIDVKVPGNEAFYANFLQGLGQGTRERLIDAAEQRSNVVTGRRLRTVISRGMSADMAAAFCIFYNDEEFREAYERNTWEYVARSIGNG